MAHGRLGPLTRRVVSSSHRGMGHNPRDVSREVDGGGRHISGGLRQHA